MQPVRPFRFCGFLLFVVLSTLASANAQQTPVLEEASPAATLQEVQKSVPEFNLTDAADLMSRLRDGFEGHNARRFLSAFDRDQMQGYLTFADRVNAFFASHEGFRVNMHVLQVNPEGQTAMLVDFQLEASPRSGERPERRAAQVRFNVARVPTGWRIIGAEPREFFY